MRLLTAQRTLLSPRWAKDVLWRRARSVPSLDLRFAQNKSLVDAVTSQSLVTFARVGSATYVDSTGTLQTAATNAPRFDHNPTTGESLGLLVEEARTNTLLYSESLANAAWNKSFGTLTPNTLLAPNGTFTGSLFQADGVSTSFLSSGIYQTFSSISSDTALSFSVYIKNNNATTIRLALGQLNNQYQNVTYTFATNTFTGSTGTTGSAQAVGNGWIRITLAISSTLYNTVRVSILPDSTNSIYIWGAQLEAGSFPTSYIPTPATFTGRTSTATYYDANGVIQTALSGVARSNAYFPDSSGVMRSAGLLLEGAGTNNITNSSNFSSWNLGGLTLQANVIAGLDGTVTASKIVETSTSTSKIVYKAFSSALTIGSPSTLSLYVKAGERFRVAVTDAQNNHGGYFNLNTFETSVFNGSPTLSIANVGGGWRRCSVTYTPTSSTACQPRFYIVNNAGAVNYTGDGVSGLYIWGAQLESGSLVTSYIPTTTATVTRSADTSTSATVTRSADVAQMTGTNFSSWYRQDEGTLFAQLNKIDTSTNEFVVGFGYDANNYVALGYQNTQFLAARPLLNGLVTTGGFPSITNVSRKVAVSYRSTGASCYLDSIYSSTPASVAGVPVGASGTLYLGTSPFAPSTYAVSRFSRLTYYPVRLPDATLQTLTK